MVAFVAEVRPGARRGWRASLLCLALLAAPGWALEPPAMHVTAAFGGVLPVGGPVALRVEVRGGAPPWDAVYAGFSGARSSVQESLTTRLDRPPGSTGKGRYWLCLPTTSAHGEADVWLRQAHNELRLAATHVTWATVGDAVLDVHEHDTDCWTDGLLHELKTVRATPDTIPPDARALAGWRAVLLHERLPEALRATLATYVRRGGRVVLASGFRGSFGGFTVSGAVHNAAGAPAAIRARYGPGPTPGPLSAVQCGPEAEILAQAGGQPLVARQRLGLGEIVFLAGPWRQEALWLEALGYLEGGTSRVPGLDAKSLLSRDAAEHLAPWWLVVLPSLIYLAVLLTLQRRALRRGGPALRAWLVTPLVVIAATGATCGLARLSKGTRTVLKTDTHAQLVSGERAGVALTYASVYAPGHRTHELVLPPGATAVAAPEGSIEDTLVTACDADGQTRLRDFRTKPWTVRAVACQHPVELDGTVELDLERRADGLHGRVVNRLPWRLENVSLGDDSKRFVDLPPLPPGGSVVIRAGQPVAQPRPPCAGSMFDGTARYGRATLVATCAGARCPVTMSGESPARSVRWQLSVTARPRVAAGETVTLDAEPLVLAGRGPESTERWLLLPRVAATPRHLEVEAPAGPRAAALRVIGAQGSPVKPDFRARQGQALVWQTTDLSRWVLAGNLVRLRVPLDARDVRCRVTVTGAPRGGGR